MGRAFSWSLAAHAAFIVSFLLLSATRTPLTIPQVVRPVRLVAYLEPAAAPRAARLPAEPRLPQPPVAPIPNATTATAAAPAAVPRVVIPVREKEPVAARSPARPIDARPALSERLARRLAAAAPAASPAAEIAAPRITTLPPVAPVVAANPDRTVAETPPATPGAIVPVGYFPHAWYLAVLKEKIFARWSPPSDFFQNSRPPFALVSFRVDRAGGIGNITLKESSGAARFDKSALAAVQSLGRIPALPEQYREETLDVVIRFQNQ